MSKSYEDEIWLTNAYPLATIEQLDAFVERVAIKTADGISDTTARQQAYNEIILSKVVR
jgi:hypothetical protein